MCGRHDARSLMHGETHKPLGSIGYCGAGVKSHANPKRGSPTEVDVHKGALRFKTGSHRLFGVRKGHEHPVAARAELVAAMATERLAQHVEVLVDDALVRGGSKVPQ